MENKKKKIILASSSPRRIAIMRNHGIEPLVIPPETDETLAQDLNEKEAVMYLALKKALTVEKLLQTNDDQVGGPILGSKEPVLILAADTIVYKNRIIGKPKDEEDALNIFESLRATFHDVITGVAILEAETANRHIFYETTRVFFKDYSREEIEDYINTDEPWDKAGGYAIQGTFGKYVDHYEGDLENIIGFPWTRIEQELEYFKKGSENQ